MGQQQLLLLVLALVVVGLAIVGGIEAMGYYRKRFNADALSQTSVRIAAEAQAWLFRPTAFGGGGTLGSGAQGDFSGLTLTLATLGYPVTVGDVYSTTDGTYRGAVRGAEFVITANSRGEDASSFINLVCTIVSGTTDDDIAIEVNPAAGTC
ncbi:MAG: hypothetical protein R2834_01475 [Rhodothermales bacterium]